jgi:hypothetical protein
MESCLNNGEPNIDIALIRMRGTVTAARGHLWWLKLINPFRIPHHLLMHPRKIMIDYKAKGLNV